MKTNHMKKFILLVSLFAVSQASWAACDQTLSPGANIAGAIASASNGATICLNPGNYGSVSFANIARSGYATLASTSGMGAVMSPTVSNSKFIRFESMSLTNMLITKTSANVQVVNSKFVPGQAGFSVVNSSYILIDNVDFTNVNAMTWDGRLNLNNASFSKVTNSLFAGVGTSSTTPQFAAADGIMLIGQANNNVIGPNNTFRDIHQSKCDVANPGSHCDSIQIYGAGPKNLITENHFYNSDIYIMSPDGADSVTVTNNVFGDSSVGLHWKVKFGSASNTRFEHNTLINCGTTFDSKPGNTASTNAVIKNNLSIAGSYSTARGSGCTNCTFDHNMFSRSADAMGANNIIGTATFTGGASPKTYAGFSLATSSIGYKAATDGKDMGAIVSGSYTAPDSPPPPPPTTIESPKNLRKSN